MTLSVDGRFAAWIGVAALLSTALTPPKAVNGLKLAKVRLPVKTLGVAPCAVLPHEARRTAARIITGNGADKEGDPSGWPYPLIGRTIGAA